MTASGYVSSGYVQSVNGATGVVTGLATAASVTAEAAARAAADGALLAKPTIPATLNPDFTTASTALADLTGMAATLVPGVVEIEWNTIWQGSVGGGAAVGLGPNVQLVAGGGLVLSGTLRYRVDIQTSASTRNRYYKTGFSQPQAPGSGAQTANNDYELSIFGRFTVTTGGTLTPQVAVAAGLGAGTLKIMTGSYVKAQVF